MTTANADLFKPFHLTHCALDTPNSAEINRDLNPKHTEHRFILRFAKRLRTNGATLCNTIYISPLGALAHRFHFGVVDPKTNTYFGQIAVDWGTSAVRSRPCILATIYQPAPGYPEERLREYQ